MDFRYLRLFTAAKQTLSTCVDKVIKVCGVTQRVCHKNYLATKTVGIVARFFPVRKGEGEKIQKFFDFFYENFTTWSNFVL